MQDPLPVPESSNGPIVHHNYQEENEAFEPKPKPAKTKKEPVKSDFVSENKDKLVFYNPDTGKWDSVKADAGQAAAPNKPVTENGLFFFGGQHYQIQNPNGVPSRPPGNKTEEIKIFWSSVGDAIENVPFLPIQINVPDMLSAMATFLSNSIPLIDRIRNPNEPRPIMKPIPPESDGYSYGPYERIDQDDQDIEYRRMGEKPSDEETKSVEKKEEQEKEKFEPEGKLGKGSVKRIFKRPVRPLRPFPTSTEDLVKIWHGSQSEGSAKIKNMPITRKKFHVADREFFNFKNSDISNSPIMILNMPSRPMMYYKIKHHHVSGDKGQEVTEIPVRPTEMQPRPPQNTTAQISRRRKLRKESKKAAKKATRRVKPNQKRRQ